MNMTDKKARLVLERLWQEQGQTFGSHSGEQTISEHEEAMDALECSQVALLRPTTGATLYVVTLHETPEYGNPGRVIESLAFQTRAGAKAYRERLERENALELDEEGEPTLYVDSLETILA